MHKRRLNEFKLTFAMRPQGPLLIKSGQESGADPTLLDMNFVRTYHASIGEDTVYLPGSSLKGTLRSYSEKIARTVGEGREVHPPFSCNPLGDSASIGRENYYCGQYMDKQRGFTQADKHKYACPICRTFGHTSLAAHLHITDAYPIDPSNPQNNNYFLQANQTEERDGVAIDRVSGAVAFGPFNLEVVTQGAFFATLTVHNFQLWQIGLLAVTLRDLSQGLVPIGFAKSRGLGRVTVDFLQAEIAYPGRFTLHQNGLDFERTLYDVSGLLSPTEVNNYAYTPVEKMPELPPGFTIKEDGDFGRVVLTGEGEAIITELWRQCVPCWRDFVYGWQGVTRD